MMEEELQEQVGMKKSTVVFSIIIAIVLTVLMIGFRYSNSGFLIWLSIFVAEYMIFAILFQLSDKIDTTTNSSMMQRVIVKMGISLFVILIHTWIFFIPKYPHIDKNIPIADARRDIQDIVGSNFAHLQVEATDGVRKISEEEYNQDINKLEQNLKECDLKNDTDCMINEYNEFMDKWVSDDKQQKQCAAFVIEIFGVNKLAEEVYPTVCIFRR